MNYILTDISRNRLTIPVSVVIAIVLGSITFFTNESFLPSVQPLNPIWNYFSETNSFLGTGVLINLLLVMVTGWGLFKMNENFALSHFRSALPFLFYLLFQVTNPPLQSVSEGSVAAILISVALFVLFGSYQAEKSSEHGFLIGMLMGGLSMVWSRAIFYFPVFIIGLWMMRSLRLKTLLAALIGLVTLYWLQFALYFFNDKVALFPVQFEGLFDFSIPDITQIPLWIQVNVVVTFLIGLISGTKLLISNLQEKVRTQACYNFVILLSTVASALLVFDSSDLTGHLTIMYMTIALLAGDVFTASVSKGSVALFFTIIAIYAALFGWFFIG